MKMSFRPPCRVRHHSHGGFSLIELLVVIGVIGLLAGLILPMLTGARQSSQQLKSLANLRSIAQLFDHYAMVNKQAYPIAEENRMYPAGCHGTMMGFDHWQVAVQWPGLLHDFAPWSENKPAFLSPRAQRADDSCGWPTSYAYSNSFVARPEVWRGNASSRFLSATFTHEVQFPSLKVLAWDWELPYIPRPLNRIGRDLDEATPMVFADGHGGTRRPVEATDPVPNPFLGSPHLIARLHNTADGVRGRDY
jgi:prepilin-type N-terminal cleavage/methylation domain-containing protein